MTRLHLLTALLLLLTTACASSDLGGYPWDASKADIKKRYPDVTPMNEQLYDQFNLPGGYAERLFTFENDKLVEVALFVHTDPVSARKALERKYGPPEKEGWIDETDGTHIVQTELMIYFIPENRWEMRRQ